MPELPLQDDGHEKVTKTRDQIIQEIKELWPGHLQDQHVILGEQTSNLAGLFSRNDLKRICVGMTTLAVRLKLEGKPEEVTPGG